MKIRDYSPTKKEYMSGSVVINHINETLFRIDIPSRYKQYTEEYVFELIDEQWYLLGNKFDSFLHEMDSHHIQVGNIKMKDLPTNVNNSASQA